MQLIRHPFIVIAGVFARVIAGANARASTRAGIYLVISLLVCGQVFALETDRQKPLEVTANSTDGTLGDGVTTLRGDVDIRQGTLHITADEAQVIKADGRVQKVTFLGKPAFLEQEIEEQGLVQATANSIDYAVASGLVTLSGKADVKHPQYQISGDLLTYDLNIQHFEGNGDNNGNGRIIIRLDPEVLDDPNFNKSSKNKKQGENKKADETPNQQETALQVEQEEFVPEYDDPFADDPNAPDPDADEPDAVIPDSEALEPDNNDPNEHDRGGN